MADAAFLIQTIAPEFTLVDVTGAVEAAEMQIADGLGGDKRPLLVAYLAAHILTIARRSGAGGGVAALKEGDLSINYTGSGEGIMATSYGAEFDRLSRGCVFAARTRVAHA